MEIEGNWEDVIQEAFGQVIAEYNLAVDQTIEDPSAFADLGFNDQDIIDTGRLRDSKEIDAQPNEVSFTWDPTSPENGFKYAAAVWAGFFAFGGPKFIPGRHWPERAAYDMGLSRRFVELLKEGGLEAELIKDGDEDLDY